MKTFIAVLCGPEPNHWLHPTLGMRLIEAGKLPDVRVEPIYGVYGYEAARNRAVELFLQSDCELLCTIDNDNSPPVGFLPTVWAFIKSREDADIVCLPYYMRPAADVVTSLLCVGWRAGEPNTYHLATQLEPGWQTIDVGGAGAMVVSRKVLMKMPRPFRMPNFAWENNLLSGVSEDFDFCIRAKEQGFNVWTNGDLCDHFHTVNLSLIAKRVAIRSAEDREILQRLGIACPTAETVKTR